MTQTSRPPSYFETLYAAAPDPWDFETSAYEAEKYRVTIAALGGRRYKNAFEAGCSIGVLTQQLAAHCDRLLAADIVPAALDAAAARCAALPHVSFRKLLIPADWPKGETFDLIILSEILYFLDPASVRHTAQIAGNCLARGGAVILVNYTAPIDEPCSGDAAANHFITAFRPLLRTTILREKHRIDILRGRK